MVDWSGLRALVSEVNFELISGGCDVTVRRPAPDSDPIETRGIWMTPLTGDFPGDPGSGFNRREPVRVMALPKTDVPTVPRGTLIEAALETGGDIELWQVDGIERVEADHTRAVVVPVST